MKSKIIFLGMVALSFINANATTVFENEVLDQQESVTFNLENVQHEKQLILETENTTSRTLESNSDTTVFDPKTVINSDYKKAVEEVIADNKLITGDKEEAFSPLELEIVTQDRITENGQIIEDTISNEIFPLNFDKIAGSAKCAKDSANATRKDLKL